MVGVADNRIDSRQWAYRARSVALLSSSATPPIAVDSRQSAYRVRSERAATTYANFWTAPYLEQLLNSLGRDIASDIATRGLTPEDLDEILHRVREKEFQARYGA